MARTGPPPPDPNWIRLDERGINSTRYAWGYISPDEKAIVKDDGSIYMLIDPDELEKRPTQKAYHIRYIAKSAAWLRRCLQWSKIVREMYIFDKEISEEEPIIEKNVVVSTPKKKSMMTLKRNRRV
jgi:hypothetical protein